MIEKLSIDLSPRVSYDFDGTLTLPVVQSLAEYDLAQGRKVFVVTSRCPNFRNDDLFALCEKLGIKEKNIVFTCMAPKGTFLKSRGITTHYDDDPTIISEINEDYPRCTTINVSDL